MGELETYSLIDFMPMGPEVYLRLFVRQNQMVWPAQPLGLLLGLVALWSAWRGLGRMLGGVLGFCWLWVGYTFHLRLFAELNWAAVYAGWGFVLEGLLLAGLGLAGRLDRPADRPLGTAGFAGLGLAAFALVAYPLLIPLTRRDWQGIELFGTMPDPTALATLGLLLLAGGRGWPAMVVPILWCALSSLIWWAMGWNWGLMVGAGAALALSAGLWRGGSRPPCPAAGNDSQGPFP